MNPSPYPARFTSAHGRATIVKILLIVGAIGTVLLLVAETLTLVFPLPTDDQEIGDNQIAIIVALMGFLVGVLSIIIYFVTVVFFCMWLYRAYDNLRALNPWRRLEHSPGWAVGSFFIPFVNLVVPYRAVRELWQKSGPADEALLSEPGPPAWFPVWWTFWLLASISGNISLRLSFNENVPESTAMIVSIVANALSIVAALFAYIVVDAIDRRQEETAKAGNFAGPPLPPANFRTADVVAPTT